MHSGRYLRTRKPIGHQRSERAQYRGRQHARRTYQADGYGAADIEGHYRQTDKHGPFRRNPQPPTQHQPAQRHVAQYWTGIL
jgi:hypothetical protein